MSLFSETCFQEAFDFSDLEQTVASTIRLAAHNPVALNLFFQRYTYFNGIVSAVMFRLASSIAMCSYLFNNPETLVIEKTKRGYQISAEAMITASDEEVHGIIHRKIAQLMLKTVGDYAELSTNERNQFSQVPTWLNKIVNAVIANSQGTPSDGVSLIQAIGFYTASKILGEREYALLDMIIRHENQGVGFDRYLKEQASFTEIGGHQYNPWCWIKILRRYEGCGVELKHFELALTYLNLSDLYRHESKQQIYTWAFQGFAAFVELQQRLFREISRECLELLIAECGFN